MKNFKIVPLSREYAAKIREANIDQFGNTVIESIATGKGPCRVSLKPFEVGKDSRLLLSHSPFFIANPFNQAGPVFIHKTEIEPYSDIYRFPPEIGNDRKSFPLSFIGYSKDQMMIFSRLVGEDDIDLLLEKTLDGRPDIEFLHARNSAAGCFICKIERI